MGKDKEKANGVHGRNSRQLYTCTSHARLIFTFAVLSEKAGGNSNATESAPHPWPEVAAIERDRAQTNDDVTAQRKSSTSSATATKKKGGGLFSRLRKSSNDVSLRNLWLF